MSYIETFVGSCGHSFEAECRCIADPFGGGMCDMHMDAPLEVCPDCWHKLHPYTPKKRWWLLGKVF